MKKRVKMSIINLGVLTLVSTSLIHANQNEIQNICPKKIPADIIIKQPEKIKKINFNINCSLTNKGSKLDLQDKTLDHFLLKEGLKPSLTVNTKNVIQYCRYDAMHTSNLSDNERQEAYNKSEWIILECLKPLERIDEAGLSRK